MSTGCTRTHYRLDADAETYSILDEKTMGQRWRLPLGFSIEPDMRSRLHNPTAADDPMLPIPAPQLYAYRLPTLPARDPDRFQSAGAAQTDRDPGIMVPSHLAIHDPDAKQDLTQLASYQESPGGTGSEPLPDRSESGQFQPLSNQTVMTIRPIPKSVWESLPQGCLIRMFEFPSVRAEYERAWDREPTAAQRDPSPRLALEDIVDIGLLNSRPYQTQKENLYRAALRLSLERYDYVLKFSTGGNGTATHFSHQRNRGITNNQLSIPTTITGDKVLATGGDLLARFANDVVLTFNGPDGFAADVGSELLLELSQSVFQRDIVFEQLTQAERDVVYAARDFARFRKQFFRDLAVQYYSLILTYRRIEIDTQDYFSNLRAYEQHDAEYRAGQLPRIQVDQVEQNVLSSRSNLIGSCNSLESSLDQMKLTIGLPPELPINLDLTELEMLTLRDESTVSGELVRRARRDLLSERDQDAPDQSVLLNGAINLAQRMLDASKLQERLGELSLDVETIKTLLARLRADEAEILVDFNRRTLAQEKATTPPPPPVRIFQRTMECVHSIRLMIECDLQLAERIGADPEAIASFRDRVRDLLGRYEQIQEDLEEAIANRQLDRVQPLIQEAEAVLDHANALSVEVKTMIGKSPRAPAEALAETIEQVDWLLHESEQTLRDELIGLTPIEIDMDDAMLTALVQRFDLMNERGALADTWRFIKLAGDDLRSVMNLNASQVVRTRSDVNRPFDFTFDDSQTQLSMTLDTPFNRKSQRNTFRQSLINYNAALRNLTELEDGIKLDIRDELRQLQLDRDQYQIAIASAALAYERVVSTRLEFELGIREVDARDFLESQQAYTASLIAVAGRHISYISDRIQLFLDLELLEVDDRGFWPELYNEGYQPAVDAIWPGPACPPYGELPGYVRYSCPIRRMDCVPFGTPTVHKASNPPGDSQPAGIREPMAPEPMVPEPEPIERPAAEPIVNPFPPTSERSSLQ